jgi:hypothetical protein
MECKSPFLLTHPPHTLDAPQALSVLVNQKAKPAARRLAYSFLRGCKGHGSPSWTSTITPVIVNDASSPDEHIAAAALRLVDSYPSESLALSLPSIAPLLLGILRGRERGGERVRCEAVNLLYSLLLSPDRSPPATRQPPLSQCCAPITVPYFLIAWKTSRSPTGRYTINSTLPFSKNN